MLHTCTHWDPPKEIFVASVGFVTELIFASGGHRSSTGGGPREQLESCVIMLGVFEDVTGLVHSGRLKLNVAAGDDRPSSLSSLLSHVERLKLCVSRPSRLRCPSHLVLVATTAKGCAALSPWTQRIPSNRKYTGFSDRDSVLGRVH